MSKEKKGGKPVDAKLKTDGIGDAYAYAVADVAKDAKKEKGSNQDAWLGVSKKALNPLDYVGSTLHGKK